MKRAAKALAARGGRNGDPRGRVLAVWADMMAWCGRPENMTNGFFPDDETGSLPDKKPLDVLEVMAIGDPELGPMVERKEARGGWQVRNYGEYQPLKEDIEERRRKEKDRKRSARMGLSGRTPTGHRKDGAAGQSAVSDYPVPSQPVPSRPVPVGEQPTAFHPSGSEEHPDSVPSVVDVRKGEVTAGGVLWQFEAMSADGVLREFSDTVRRVAADDAAVGRVLGRLAHDVLDRRDAGAVVPADVAEATKALAGAVGVPYDARAVGAALDSAEAQREAQTPAEAALRVAENLLRAAPGLALPIREFQRLVFERVNEAWPADDLGDWRQDVVSILWQAEWPKVDRKNRFAWLTTDIGDNGKRLLKPVVGAYVWKGGTN